MVKDNQIHEGMIYELLKFEGNKCNIHIQQEPVRSEQGVGDDAAKCPNVDWDFLLNQVSCFISSMNRGRVGRPHHPTA